MSIPGYEYPIDECDVAEERRPALIEFRALRRECLDRLKGGAITSVMKQVHDLTWHTLVFRSLNEARRLEPQREVNGAMWELTSLGYASLMTLGIRRLVDRDSRANSVWNVIKYIEPRHALCTRENLICHDGLPYDYEALQKRDLESTFASDKVPIRWLDRTGPGAWATTERLHDAFDAVSGSPAIRERGDAVRRELLPELKTQLEHATVKKVCAMVNQRVAHADRIAERSAALPVVTYKDIDDALRIIVRVANFLGSAFFLEHVFGPVVATPQFDVMQALGQPWVTSENVPKLVRQWHHSSEVMNQWAYATNEGFLTENVTAE